MNDEIDTCKYIHIVSKYIVSILQVMNVTFSKSYTNNLISTKCLNTAVMLIILLLGDKKIKAIQQCDVPNTIKRHISFEDNNKLIADKLIKSLCKSSVQNCLYYIMLTDGRLSNSIYINQTKYFPGHVFIVEKRQNDYYIYQSYISKYDLNAFMVKNKCKKYNVAEVKNMCMFFKKFLGQNYVWDDVAVEKWLKLTDVDTSEFKSYNTNNIFICFKKFRVKTVKNMINRFIETSLADIQKHINDKNVLHYMSTSFLHNSLSSKPYDIGSLKKNFEKMNKELNSI